MTRRQKAIAIIITFCVLLVAAAISLNVSWILITARRDFLLILGVILFALIIAGIIVYTVFLVVEIRRNEEHDSFINAVTHELKTPIASIQLYLETLQSRPVSARHGLAWYELDINWIGISLLKAFGLAWDVRVAKIKQPVPYEENDRLAIVEEEEEAVA